MKKVPSKAKRIIHHAVDKESSMVEAIVEKVKTYLKDEGEIFNKENVIKYTALAIVTLYGLRSGGWLRSLILSVVTGVITEHLLENAAQKEAA